jgi:hypothetical protein
MPNESIPKGLEYTDQTKKDYEKLKQICSRKIIPNFHKYNCVLLKKNLDDERKNREREVRQLNLAYLGLRRVEAITYVMGKSLFIVSEAILLSNALKSASDEYDLILSAKAAKPILGDVVFTLALTALPQLGIIARGLEKYGGPAAKSFVKLDSNSPDMWKRTASYLLDAQITKSVSSDIQTTKRFAEILDSSSKDILEAFIDPLKANAEVDAETAERLSKFATKNQILTDLIRSIEKKVVVIQRFQWIVNLFINCYEGEDLMQRVQTIINNLGYEDSNLYDPNLYEKFSDLILYDMLRAYAKTNCKIVVTVGLFKTSSFEGLDEAQRKLIYARFGSKNWKAIPNFPALDNDNDLIRHFGVKTVQTPVIIR